MKEALNQLVEIITQGDSKVKSFKETNLVQTLLTYILNTIMEKEREIHLEKTDDSKNGFYSRNLAMGTIPIQVSVPRVRRSDFFPSIIPKYSRILPEEYHTLVEGLILSTKSINSLKQTLSPLNLPYSPEQIDEIVDSLAEEFKTINSRELPSDWLVVFVDAKVLDIRSEKGEMKRAVLLTARAWIWMGKSNFWALILLMEMKILMSGRPSWKSSSEEG